MSEERPVLRKKTLKKSVRELRVLLRGYRWCNFHAKNNPIIVGGVSFECRLGLHLGRSSVAIIALGQFVALRHFVMGTDEYGSTDSYVPFDLTKTFEDYSEVESDYIMLDNWRFTKGCTCGLNKNEEIIRD